jgi:hypothetical protein
LNKINLKPEDIKKELIQINKDYEDKLIKSYKTSYDNEKSMQHVNEKVKDLNRSLDELRERHEKLFQ